MTSTANPASYLDACSRLRLDGFAFASGAQVRKWLAPIDGLDDWPEFARSWNRLGPDLPLAALGRLRRRRHASYLMTSDGDLRRLPHRPHYQTVDHNPLQGGLQRWFDPVEPDVGDGASLRALIELGNRVFSVHSPVAAGWHIEVHQFRIEAHAGQPGEPTPEGVHRDGVDWVLAMLIERVNIASGTTTVHSDDGHVLGEFTLSRPFDIALVDDARVMHGVTPVEPLDPDQPAHRDVLVITYRKPIVDQARI